MNMYMYLLFIIYIKIEVILLTRQSDLQIIIDIKILSNDIN